jgi:hypothetical protein
MRAINPTPVSRFNFDDAVEQLTRSGGELVELATDAPPFPGETRDDRWPEVLAYYTSIQYLNRDPLDEFVMLAQQLITMSEGEKVTKARAELENALTFQAEGKTAAAARCAVQSYQMLYYPP